ncbi:glutamate--tRNA ligase [Siculibacillus lacustris]|uniref:Glutamate--tRNA ligase n=1 Tax=Siculibacillus lacustris TaxID=1549641 RepID=A0A4Q9VY46_9HYPH|nr:glutamate--tRNA ligase [Siculibacillus lacustris]TBW40895.1 glutamate--tRNA ligase [Siculibacillus lacustris]
MSAPVVRFAPSPTGRIHIGNARTALLNYLFAKSRGGTFILRYDDTDTERSRPEFSAAIAEDLAWLGLVPDRVEHQSARLPRYEAAADALRAAGRLYPAFETADELERRRRRQMARGLPPVYDRAALALGPDEIAAFEVEGRRPHWRFRLDGRRVEWLDGVRGAQTIDTASLSDPVLVREDGTFLYTLTSVVDDVEMGVTDIVRGEDHVTNTAVQIEIFEALGGAVPRFAHHNLIASTTGEALSKRLGSLSIGSLREAGYEPMTVAAIAVLTGSSEEIRAYPDLAALAPHADLAAVSRSTARFDPHELDAINAHLLHGLSHSDAAPRLAALDADLGPAFWEAVRDNLGRLGDAVAWAAVVRGPIEAANDPEDRPFLAAAAALLPPEPWEDTTWGSWTAAIKAATGRKGRALFHPLRLALTGRDEGPEMKRLLPLIGRRNTSDRLS